MIGETREFICTTGSSRKFWCIRVDGPRVETLWGRIGTKGQAVTKTFYSADMARVYTDEMERKKVNKGYRRLTQIEADAVRNATALGDKVINRSETLGNIDSVGPARKRRKAITYATQRINARNEERERANQLKMNAKIEESARRTRKAVEKRKSTVISEYGDDRITVASTLNFSDAQLEAILEARRLKKGKKREAFSKPKRMITLDDD